ncbi:MerR family transcriptional regulator [Nocardioides speluncae]|uniref:MerR family transcriptional regulator n=1 Tax=Nocardioides speluncae TaxID=2670337 RepID=UPI000D691BE1|nr:MerR family transcriptional regulator [Nocardioides speluncae]
MSTQVAIGEFSRLTHLSVKTLHHYHEVGLLEPASIDTHSGYRRYAIEQVPQAHLIRRLRDLEMPVPQVREVLLAPDEATRDAAIRAHLLRMEDELRRTQSVVASLRTLLSPTTQLAIEYRTIATQPVFTVSDVVAWRDIIDWCDDAFDRVYAAIKAAGARPAGPGGGCYSQEFFSEDDGGDVMVFVPVPHGVRPAPATTGVASQDLPGGRFAVTTHSGTFDDFDRTYGALGSHVAEHHVALPDPIREFYLVGPDTTEDPASQLTEVCWPIADESADTTKEPR